MDKITPTNAQRRRAAALERALLAIARSGQQSGAPSWDAKPEEVLTYAKFILDGDKPAKKKRKVKRRPRAYWAEQGTPLPSSLEDLEAKGWRPLGYLTEDGLKEEPAWAPTIASLFRNVPTPTIPGPPTLASAALQKIAERVRDGEAFGEDVRKRVEEAIAGDRGEVRDWSTVRTKVRERLDGWHQEQVETELVLGERRGCGGCSAELERRRKAGEAETTGPDDDESSSPVGEDPGDAGILSDWAEAIRAQAVARETEEEGAKLEEDAAKDAQEGVFPIMPGVKHEDADLADLMEGSAAGCPECAEEGERRGKRDEALKRGRSKLAGRRRDNWPTGPLDDDELLAVAGRELYPAADPEPGRTEKIRNRKGDVMSYVSGATPDGYPSAGWTLDPANPWGLTSPWRGEELVRRGPWHVV